MSKPKNKPTAPATTTADSLIAYQLTRHRNRMGSAVDVLTLHQRDLAHLANRLDRTAPGEALAVRALLAGVGEALRLLQPADPTPETST